MNKNQKSKKINYEPLIIVLFLFLFTVIPLFLIWIFGTKDLGKNAASPALILPLTFGLGILSLIVNFLFFKFKIINFKSFNFNVPLVVLFWFVIGSSYLSFLNIYWRIALTFVLTIAITLLMNFVTFKYQKFIEQKLKEQNTGQ